MEGVIRARAIKHQIRIYDHEGAAEVWSLSSVNTTSLGFSDDGTDSGIKVVFKNGGNVGIGTSNPERLLELKKEKALPTQLYISLNTPNEKMYLEWHKPTIKDAWKQFNESLKIMKDLKTRRVLRMTLVKEKNMCCEKEYAELIKKADPDFIEVKGFMSVGYSRNRLSYETMPSHKEVTDFAKKVCKELNGYKVLDEKIESRVVLLGKDNKKMKIKESEI